MIFIGFPLGEIILRLVAPADPIRPGVPAYKADY